MGETHHAEVQAIDAELAGIDTRIDRYLTAFGKGTMSGEACDTCTAILHRQRQRRDELTDQIAMVPHGSATTNWP